MHAFTRLCLNIGQVRILYPVKVLEELIILLGLYNQRNLLYAMAFDLAIKAI
jgi:hypothetical protein